MNPNPPAPPRVDDIERYWTEPPPEKSKRCAWWEVRIAGGWQGNKRTRIMGYDAASTYYGVYIWEYSHVLFPLLQAKRIKVLTARMEESQVG